MVASYVNITGTSGIITPFAKTDGLYFDGSDEPQDFEFEFIQDFQEQYKKSDEKEIISLKFDDSEDYYDYVDNYDGLSINRDDGDKVFIRVQLEDD